MEWVITCLARFAKEMPRYLVFLRFCENSDDLWRHKQEKYRQGVNGRPYTKENNGSSIWLYSIASGSIAYKGIVPKKTNTTFS